MNQLSTNYIINQLLNDRTKGFIEKLSATLCRKNFDLNKVIDLTLHPDATIAFRSAWLLDTTVFSNPTVFAGNIEYFVSMMPLVTNNSCKRHYARIMKHLTSMNAPAVVKDKLAVIDLERVVETCFDWIIEPKIKVAVQVCAAETLLNLCKRYDWIEEELANQLEFMMRNGSPAIQSAGKRLLAGLKK
jgi:hypothetical protein